MMSYDDKDHVKQCHRGIIQINQMTAVNIRTEMQEREILDTAAGM